MKYYLYSKKDKKLMGFSECNKQPENSTDIEPRELSEDEVAYFINGEWVYDIREDLKEQKAHKINEDILRIYNSTKELIVNAVLYCPLVSGYKTKEKSKDISILIPCYGKARYIEDVVKSCTSQTLKAYEILVLLMDKDSQELKDSIESLGDNVRCINHERLDACKARNKLVELCKTEYFFFLDADDTIAENALEECYKQTESIVCISPYKYKIGNCTSFTVMNSNLTGLYHKEVWNELGGLDEELEGLGGEDFDFKLRIYEQAKWDIGTAYKTNFNFSFGTDNSLQDDIERHFPMIKKMWLKHKDFIIEQYEKGVPFITRFDIGIDTVKRLGEDFDIFAEEKGYNKPHYGTVQFNFGGMCDKNCAYCIDMHSKNTEERNHCGKEKELLKKFDKVLEKVPADYNVGVTGGEPSLWSEELITEILKRFENRNIIFVNSSGSNRESLWHKNNKCYIFWHITDWNEDTVIDPKKNEQPRVIVTHENVSMLEGFIKINSKVRIDVSPYLGTDERFILTEDDWKIIRSIYTRYPVSVRVRCCGHNVFVDLNRDEFIDCCTCTEGGNSVHDLEFFEVQKPYKGDCEICKKTLESRIPNPDGNENSLFYGAFAMN